MGRMWRVKIVERFVSENIPLYLWDASSNGRRMSRVRLYAA